jgi:hypothetical protein
MIIGALLVYELWRQFATGISVALKKAVEVRESGLRSQGASRDRA